MNQAFSFSRWLLLIEKHWSENRKKYLLAMVAITGILLIWFLFNIVMEQYRPMDTGIQVGSYFGGLFIVGCLYGSTLFADLASKAKGINYLSLPASQLEKTLCALFYGVVVFLVAYTLLFYVADIIMVKISNQLSYADWLKNHSSGSVFRPQEIVNVVWTTEKMQGSTINPQFIVLLCYFALQSAYILGSVYFTRFSFIKTTVALLVLWLFMIVFVGKIMDSFMPSGNYFEGLTSYRLNSAGNGEKIIRLPEWTNSITIFLLKYAFAPVLWTVTYFRVKEKEI
jgi:hypothetical protein